MIAEVFPGGNAFKPIISYLETGEGGLVRKEDRVAWTEFWNLPTRNSEVAACMMRATANASVSNTQEPVYHFSVSLHPDDPGDEPTLRKIADRTIRDLGLDEYEVVVVAHKDRSHPHLHFVVNRVHPERGTLWSPWRDYYRLERSMRAQEKEFGLQVVPGHLVPVYVLEAAGPGQEERLVRLRPPRGPRRGDVAFVADVTERATPCSTRARGQSWSAALPSKGYRSA
ncbi:MAG TPA: relaxase/mobilization nuclease domain-containing protein [Longimicrobium sp.]|nr:relaxase/mobilization nuclease domain-containing protein [Longimicrobium sp.]